MKARLPICICSLLALACLARAQQSNSAPAGLDSLDERRVTTELANRGMQTLLKRQFELNKTPPAQQSTMLTLISIQKLSDPHTNLTFQQRQDLIAQIIQGIDNVLPNMQDPTSLMQIGKVMVTSSVDPDVNALEYWGENPRTQNRVRPAIETVLKIYDKAASIAGRAADEIANKLNANDEAAVKRWQDADQLHTLASFTEFMVDYDLCLALDKSDPRRTEVADKAIAGLKTFDTNDSAVQAAVRNRIAKLTMAKGDFETARQLFTTVAQNPNADIKPAPTVAEQYEARYFSFVCQLLSDQLDDAQKGADQLDLWQRRTLESTQQKGASAALSMLQYRILSARADAAKSPDEKQKNNDQAIAVLLRLLHDQPQYKTVVFEQVLSRLPANPDLSSLDPLLLLALQQQGEQQFQLPSDQKPDRAVLERAIAAAREILHRRGLSGVDEQTAARSAYVIPYLLQKLGRQKEAASAFLDFADQFRLQFKDASDALDHATAAIGQLRKDDPEDQDTRKLYDRFLPLAIGAPYNRKQFAFEYARLLQREQQFKAAVDYFRQVPANDPLSPTARFYMMVALKQRLDDANDKMPPEQRQQILTQVQSLADQINKETIAARDAAKTDEERNRENSRLVRTALIAAGLSAQDQKDPKRTLALLDGFEEKVKGLANEQNLLFEAQSLRVNSYMALGRINDATSALVSMLKTRQGDQGPALVFDLLKKIDADMDRARSAGDSGQVSQLAQNRAVLSGFLVSWAENNPDPKTKALTPRFKIFDASTKQQAAELTNDPVAKKANLEAALKQYQDLNDPNNPDPSAQLGIGIIEFDLGNYEAAKETLGPLVANKKIGTPTMVIQQNGEPKTVENTQYWQAVLSLLRSIAAVADQNQSDAKATQDLESAKRFLKQLYVQWPKTIGGAKYHNDFEQLRAQLVPDFHPDQID